MKRIYFLILFVVFAQLSWSIQGPCNTPNPPAWCNGGGGPCNSPNPPAWCNNSNVPISTHDWILLIAGTILGIVIILKMNKKETESEGY